MLSLRRENLAEAAVPLGTSWLLGACMEARGKQDLWLRQKPEVLAALREQAMIQSAESSNRIEGVTVLANRLRPLVLIDHFARSECGRLSGRDYVGSWTCWDKTGAGVWVRHRNSPDRQFDPGSKPRVSTRGVGLLYGMNPVARGNNHS